MVKDFGSFVQIRKELLQNRMRPELTLVAAAVSNAPTSKLPRLEVVS